MIVYVCLYTYIYDDDDDDDDDDNDDNDDDDDHDDDDDGDDDDGDDDDDDTLCEIIGICRYVDHCNHSNTIYSWDTCTVVIGIDILSPITIQHDIQLETLP